MGSETPPAEGRRPPPTSEPGWSERRLALRRAAGLPARVGDPLLPGGTAPRPVPAPTGVRRQEASARREAVKAPRSRPGDGPSRTRLLMLGGAATAALVSLLAAWHHFGPSAQAASGGPVPDTNAAVAEEPSGPSEVSGEGQTGAAVPSPVPPRGAQASAPPTASASPSPSPSPQPTPSPSAGPSAAPSPSTSPSSAGDPAPTQPAELTAVMRSSHRLLGVVVSVTVTNAGPGEAAAWEVAVTVPEGRPVDEVSGAVHHRSGDQVIFTPVPDSDPLAPGEAVSFQFRVAGLFAAAPEECAIDGRPCG